MKNKIKSFIIVTACAFIAASFCGCSNSGKDNKGDTESEQPKPEKDITFNELVTDNLSTAKSFFKNLIKPQIVEQKVVKAESWYIADKDNDNKVDLATLSYIYSAGETSRVLEIATAKFNTQVSAQDIKDNKVTSVSLEISRNQIFTFDAKDNYNNQDITSALYTATKVTSSLRLYSEAEANNIDRIFNIVEMSDDQISITNLNVTKGDESKDTLLKNLANRNEYGFRETATTSIEGVKINELAYTLENINGSEIVDPNPGKDPEKPGDQEATAAEIIQALDENCKEKITTLDSIFNDTNCVSEGQWYRTKDNSGKIIEAQYRYKYIARENIAYYMVNKVEFNSPIDLKNINQETLKNANFSQCFCSEKYNPTTQDKDFADKMCNKIFGEKTGATRFITIGVERTDDILKASAVPFTVIEITDGMISQCTVIIKKSNSNDEYVSKLNDQSNYRTTSSSNYTISGEKLTID